MSDAEHLRQAILALELQRTVLGDDAVSLAVRVLRERLATLDAAPPPQQLRQVSVLFCDVVGSTTLAQHLGPEDIHEVMDGALFGFTRIVQNQGGRVLQYAGDSMLAVFGAPAAREDDAQRAVHAALAILEEARQQSDAVRRRHGHDGFGVRAGIATGGVLLGGGVDGEHSIRGMTVNVAARMEQSAAPGALRICPDTWRLVRGLFAAQPQPPLAIKGRDEPISTWLVTGLRDDLPVQAERGVDGLGRTPFVGREGELDHLGAAFDRVRQGGAGLQAVTVLADAGIGKSRLAREFRDSLLRSGRPATWLEAQAGERELGRPYGLLRQLLGQALRLRDGGSPDELRRRWHESLAPLLRSQADAAVLGHLVGLDFSTHPEVRPLLAEPRQLRDRGFFHAGQLLRHLAAGPQTLVVVLQDLHWADAGTLDFVDHLLQQADDPVLLLGLARPELAQRRPAWVAPDLPRNRLLLQLQPLPRDHATTLADALLGRLPEVPEPLRDRLVLNAAGNPYYMEELVNALVDRRIVVPAADGEGWHLHEDRLSAWPLPTTLTGVLQARLDQLSTDEAQLLQGAAVIGPVFWDDALTALSLSPAALGRLVQRQMVTERAASRLEGRREFEFRHHLLHQVCYARVLRRDRLASHACVARWLESLPGDPQHDLIADHLERGGEIERALQAWQQAADAAQQRYANGQALEHVARALALADPNDAPRRFALLRGRADVLKHMGELDGARQDLDTMAALAQRAGDHRLRADAAERAAVHRIRCGDPASAVELAQCALDAAPADAHELRLRAGLARVVSLGMLGRHAEADTHVQALLRQARQWGHQGIEAALMDELGTVAHERGDIVACIGWLQQALALHRTSGNRSHEAGAMANLGYASFVLGEFADAAQRLEQARELFARIGQRGREAQVLVNLALVSLNAEQPLDACRQATAAQAILQAVGDRASMASMWRVLGLAQLALGRRPEALPCLQQARALFIELGLRPMATEVAANLAAALQAEGDDNAHAEALRLADEAAGLLLADTSALAGAEEPLRAWLDCITVLQAASDGRAPLLLLSAHADLQARAERITDAAQRERFLQSTACHRSLLALWQQVRAVA